MSDTTHLTRDDHLRIEALRQAVAWADTYNGNDRNRFVLDADVHEAALLFYRFLADIDDEESEA